MDKQTEESIAARLHYMQQHSNDPIRLVLDSMSVVQETKTDLAKVIKVYEKILNKEIQVAEITSSLELKPEQKKEIENKLLEQYKGSSVVFLYIVNEKFLRGIQIRVGDDLINYSATNKYF